MRKTFTKEIRAVSLLTIIALTGCDCIAAHIFPELPDLVINILVALFMLILCPAPHEKQEFSLISVLMLAVIIVSTAVLDFFEGAAKAPEIKVVLIPGLMLAAVVADLKIRSKHKFANVNNLFRCVEVWNNMEDYSRNVRIILFCIYVSLLEMSAVLDDIFWSRVLLCADLLLVIVTYVRWMLTECTSSIIGRANVDRVKAIISGSFGGLRDQERLSGENKMAALYERAQNLMLEEKPFLDDKLKLGDFSRMLYTNKSYLSRTINTMSGRNFNQYVNYYRVENAVELMSSDPKMKMSEVASLSGFHNTVSFNAAFVLFKGISPGEWHDRIKYDSHK